MFFFFGKRSALVVELVVTVGDVERLAERTFRSSAKKQVSAIVSKYAKIAHAYMPGVTTTFRPAPATLASDIWRWFSLALHLSLTDRFLPYYCFVLRYFAVS